MDEKEGLSSERPAAARQAGLGGTYIHPLCLQPKALALLFFSGSNMHAHTQQTALNWN